MDCAERTGSLSSLPAQTPGGRIFVRTGLAPLKGKSCVSSLQGRAFHIRRNT